MHTYLAWLFDYLVANTLHNSQSQMECIQTEIDDCVDFVYAYVYVYVYVYADVLYCCCCCYGCCCVVLMMMMMMITHPHFAVRIVNTSNRLLVVLTVTVLPWPFYTQCWTQTYNTTTRHTVVLPWIQSEIETNGHSCVFGC